MVLLRSKSNYDITVCYYYNEASYIKARYPYNKNIYDIKVSITATRQLVMLKYVSIIIGPSMILKFDIIVVRPIRFLLQ